MKITLKTLAQATPQQVFGQAVEYFKNAESPCLDERTGERVYRCNGKTCVAGDFISDEDYAEHTTVIDENESWETLIDLGVAPDVHGDLIAELQHYVHDKWQPQGSKPVGQLDSHLQSKLALVASTFELRFPLN